MGSVHGAEAVASGTIGLGSERHVHEHTDVGGGRCAQGLDAPQLCTHTLGACLFVASGERACPSPHVRGTPPSGAEHSAASDSAFVHSAMESFVSPYTSLPWT